MKIISKKGVKIYNDYYIDMEIVSLDRPKIVKIPTAYGGEAVVWQKTVGDSIKKFDIIAYLKHGIPVYSTYSGIFKEIYIGPDIKNVSGMQYAVIETKEDNTPLASMWSTALNDTKNGLKDIILKAGIVEEYTKKFLYEIVDNDSQYNTIVINAVDDQPYDLSKTAVLQEYKNEVIGGAKIFANAFNIKNIKLVLLKNFRTEHMIKNGVEGIMPIVLKGKYPMEPAIDEFALKQKGIVIGVQALKAIYRAAVFGEPQLSSVVTVWGNGVLNPRNLEVLNGTTVENMLFRCQANGVIERVIGGGIMRGYVASPSLPLFRGDSALTVMPLKKHNKLVDCINCGRCAGVCPMGLAPYYILRSSKNPGNLHAKQLCADLCIDCGACAYNCPARIPLNEKIRLFKMERGAQYE